MSRLALSPRAATQVAALDDLAADTARRVAAVLTPEGIVRAARAHPGAGFLAAIAAEIDPILAADAAAAGKIKAPKTAGEVRRLSPSSARTVAALAR